MIVNVLSVPDWYDFVVSIVHLTVFVPGEPELHINSAVLSVHLFHVHGVESM